MRKVGLALIAVWTVVAGLALVSPAGAEPPGSGGGGSGVRGYELQSPSGTHFCLAADGTRQGVVLTTACNFHNPRQQWIALRDGHWTTMQNVAMGTCLYPGPGTLGACAPGYSSDLMFRTTASEWRFGYFEKDVQCLTGSYNKGNGLVHQGNCDLGLWTQVWHVTGA